MSRTLLALALVSVSFGMARAQSGSNVQHTENRTDQALRADIRVDPSTLGMSFSIPLAMYPGRAGNSVPVTIKYNSKLWRIAYDYTVPGQLGTYTWTKPKYAETSTAGWTSSLEVPWIEYTGREQYYDSEGNGVCDFCDLENPTTPYYVKRIHVHLPDGSSHELLEGGPYEWDGPELDFTGTFTTVDGSRMYFVTANNTLYLPDGSRYVFGTNQSVNIHGKLGQLATTYIDSNGNRLTYNLTTRTWTDTLGRLLVNPIPNVAPTVATEQTYSLPGFSGTQLTYKLRWEKLENVLRTVQPLKYTGDRKCTAPPVQQLTGALFETQDYFTYVCAQTAGGVPELFNPVVLKEVELPNLQKYQFKYNIYGEIEQVLLPTGGYERFQYAAFEPLSGPAAPYGQSNRGVSNHWVSVDGATEVSHTQYSQASATVRTTAPDGSYSERTLIQGSNSNYQYPFGFDPATTGMISEERSYSATGQMLRRKLYQWTESGPTPRDPRLTKEISIILDTGGNALAATTTYQHDADFNVISTSQYDFASVAAATGQTGAISAFPNGALIRTAETTFLVNDTAISSTTRQAYRDRNLVALPTSSRVKNAAGTIVAQSEIKYDEAAYPPLTYGAVTGWADPATTIRGMATTSRSWLNPGGTWLETHAQYDQCGNPRKSWDARGYLSEVEYSSTYKFAYPTRTVSADPDGAGAGTSLITTSTYDFNSGAPTSTLDANSQSSTFQYALTDTLGNSNQLQRPTKVIRPDGGWTAYGYSYTPGNLFIVTKTALDVSQNTEATEYFDGLGRPWRKEQSEGATSIYTDLQYDSMGRNWKTSNPYRTGTPLWTTNTYDALGRVLIVKTPDNATVTSSYSGNTVTVTDQAGKKRKTVTDALGRLQEVYEDPTTLNYLTSYDYDALDNLTTVTQGAQTRTFVYDSLKRLKTATNPESGIVNYTYDNNSNLLTKVDARPISTTFTYDGLNRVTLKNYSDTTPDVRYFYDAQALPAGAPSFIRGSSLGRLVAVTTGGTSEGTYRGYDVMGQVVRQYQRTDSNNYLVEATYDLAGSLATQTYPSVPGAADRRTVSYTSDVAGRLTSLQSDATSYAPEASVSGIGYAPHNALTTETYGNTLVHAVTYNNRLQPTAIKLGTAAAPTSKVSLTYNFGTTNNNGNVQSITYAGGGLSYTQTFGYDALNRLTTSQEGATWSQTNSYDRYGNRAIVGAALSFSASNNRITNSGYIYDAAGSLTNDSTQTFTYDAENKITKVDNVSAYVYDGEGNRVRKLVEENLRFIYGIGGELIAEFSGATGALQKEFIYGASGLVATIEPTAVNANGTRYTTSDHLGTPRVVTSSAAAVVSRHDFKPFGEEIGAGIGARTTGMGYSAVDGLRQKFTSKERDIETGLDYFLARYYSSTQGRFTSSDEFSGGPDELYYFAVSAADNPTFYADLRNPQSLNKYHYSFNNPLRYLDADGHEAEEAHPDDPKPIVPVPLPGLPPVPLPIQPLTPAQAQQLADDVSEAVEAVAKPVRRQAEKGQQIGALSGWLVEALIESLISPTVTANAIPAAGTPPLAQPMPPPPPAAAKRHRKGKRESTRTKHEKPRPGRPNTKDRKNPDWRPRQRPKDWPKNTPWPPWRTPRPRDWPKNEPWPPQKEGK